MAKKIRNKNIIQIVICAVLIVAFAIPTGIMLKKAALGADQSVNIDYAKLLNAEDTDVQEVLAEADTVDEVVEEEPAQLICMVEDGIYRGTGITEVADDPTSQNAILSLTENANGKDENTLTVGFTSESETLTEVESEDETDSEKLEDEDTQNEEIFLLSFDEETIVKRIDGYVEKEPEKEEVKKEASKSEDKLVLSGISQSDNVAKKSKDLECKYNPLMDITLSDEEYEILCRIVEAEAGDQDIYGRILVANVILNRTQYWEFPDTVKGVVFQVNSKGAVQFSPVANGSFYKVKISKMTKKAVNTALKGNDYSDGALYFFMRSATSRDKSAWFDSLDFILKYGCHEFFK